MILRILSLFFHETNRMRLNYPANPIIRRKDKCCVLPFLLIIKKI